MWTYLVALVKYLILHCCSLFRIILATWRVGAHLLLLLDFAFAYSCSQFFSFLFKAAGLAWLLSEEGFFKLWFTFFMISWWMLLSSCFVSCVLALAASWLSLFLVFLFSSLIFVAFFSPSPSLSAVPVSCNQKSKVSLPTKAYTIDTYHQTLLYLFPSGLFLQHLLLLLLLSHVISDQKSVFLEATNTPKFSCSIVVPFLGLLVMWRFLSHYSINTCRLVGNFCIIYLT
jgi:hypothetical protein